MIKEPFKLGRECSTCFFREGFPGVTLDSSGRCNYCLSDAFVERHNSVITHSQDELLQAAAELKASRTGKYDCIIAISGGFDSCYVVYVCVKMLDLNPLIVFWDRGWHTELARQNIDTLCKQFDLDLEHYTCKKGFDRKYLQQVIKAFDKADMFWGLMGISRPFEFNLYKVALRHNIKTIITHVNTVSDDLWKLLPKPMKREAMLRSLRVSPLSSMLHLGMSKYYLFRLKMDNLFPPLTNVFRSYPKKPAGMKQLDLSKYIPWDMNDIAKTLTAETDWQMPAAPKLPVRYDCMLDDAFVDYQCKKFAGITDHGLICNMLIYNKMKTKEQLQTSFEYYEDTDRLIEEKNKLKQEILG